MKYSYLGALVFMSLFIVIGCSNDESTKKRKSNQTVVNSAELETFYAVRMGIASMTIIESGEEQSYRINASKEDLEKIKVSVRKGTLVFGLKHGENLSEEVNIVIVGSGLESIQLAGSGRLVAQNDVLRRSESTIVLSSSGTVRVEGDKLKELTAILSGSGTIDLSGTGKKLDVVISGSGDVKAFDFIAQEVKINLSGSGICEVEALNQLDAVITGSGNVLYTGNPEIRKRVTGSGSINKKDQ